MEQADQLQAAIDQVSRGPMEQRTTVLPHLMRYIMLLEIVDEMTRRYDRGHQGMHGETRKKIRRLLAKRIESPPAAPLPPDRSSENEHGICSGAEKADRSGESP